MSPKCPRCSATEVVKNGKVHLRQRYLCKDCRYHFTVSKLGKQIDPYYMTKALQLYLEGLSLRDIEKIVGISHVTISSWVKKHNIPRLFKEKVRTSYRVLRHQELLEYLSEKQNLKNRGIIVSELGERYILITWEHLI